MQIHTSGNYFLSAVTQPFFPENLFSIHNSQNSAQRGSRAIRIITAVDCQCNGFFKFTVSVKEREDNNADVVKRNGTVHISIFCFQIIHHFFQLGALLKCTGNVRNNMIYSAGLRDIFHGLFYEHRSVLTHKGKRFQRRNILLRVNALFPMIQTPVTISKLYPFFRPSRTDHGPDFRADRASHGIHEKFICESAADRRLYSSSVIPLSVSVFVGIGGIAFNEFFHQVITCKGKPFVQ